MGFAHAQWVVPLREGWLLKQGQMGGRFRRRYFVLLPDAWRFFQARCARALPSILSTACLPLPSPYAPPASHSAFWVVPGASAPQTPGASANPACSRRGARVRSTALPGPTRARVKTHTRACV